MPIVAVPVPFPPQAVEGVQTVCEPDSAMLNVFVPPAAAALPAAARLISATRIGIVRTSRTRIVALLFGSQSRRGGPARDCTSFRMTMHPLLQNRNLQGNP